MDRRCTYLVAIECEDDWSDDLRELAEYLSFLQVAGCDVVVADSSAPERFERNRRTLRWVARHVALDPQLRTPGGAPDLVRAGVALAACEKVVVADANVRYGEDELRDVCEILDIHEAVGPQEYLDPMPWWCSIDSSRMLLHRGIEPYPDHAATFAFRRGAVRALRAIELDLCDQTDDHLRRLASQGAEVHAAPELFVKRQPPELWRWWRDRPRQAADDFAMPVKSAFFFALIPLAVLLTLLGGARVAAGSMGAIAVASIALAVRGRIGAVKHFPLRACLCAPLWVLERSVSVYWATLQRLTPSIAESKSAPAAERASSRVASGE